MRKFLIVVALFYGVYWYASRHFDFDKTLVYAKKNPAASWAPAADYYAGLVYYQRGDYPKAQTAFTQLLTDYPTCHYAPKGMLRLSEVAEENRDYATERDILQKFLEEYPEHPDKNLAAKRLEMVKFK